MQHPLGRVDIGHGQGAEGGGEVSLPFYTITSCGGEAKLWGITSLILVLTGGGTSITPKIILEKPVLAHTYSDLLLSLIKCIHECLNYCVLGLYD